jgi:hypothetical protein
VAVELTKWTYPDSYFGPSYDGYYYVVGQNRDSDYYCQSNFQVALERLGGESDTVIVARASHWACGWVEHILVHESDEERLGIARDIINEIEDYPILDEDHYDSLIDPVRDKIREEIWRDVENGNAKYWNIDKYHYDALYIYYDVMGKIENGNKVWDINLEELKDVGEELEEAIWEEAHGAVI